MFKSIVLSGALVACAAAIGVAQVPTRPSDPVFVRAQALVSDGNGAAGRALVDSVIRATPPIAPLYPQALFWRASLAASAADAESDYKHIVVDYPLAPQAADALLRLAQLELARGDRDGALAHLQRIPRDYPRSKLLARSSYWTARVLFEKNDIPSACAANASALTQADTTEIELRNQIQSQGQRCPSSAMAVVAPNPATATPNAPTVVPQINDPVTPSTVTILPSSGTAPTTPVSVPPQGEHPKPPTQANDAKPSIVDPGKAPKRSVEKAAPKAESSAKPGSGYSVQVAAYSHRPDAEKLVSTLKTRGYEARVDGSVAPFRVRIGRYATEKDAEAALR